MSMPDLDISPQAQLNWLSRYIPLRAHLAGAEHSLLEVGSGAHGVGCILSEPFVGIDIAFEAAPVAPMFGVQYSGGRLPFKTAAFHTVLSIDAYEHVPPAFRHEFLGELARVSAERVVLAFPADAAAVESDRFMQQLYRHLNLGDPGWLREHEEHGMPSSAEAQAALDALAGWRWREVPTTGNLASLLLLLADVLPGADAWVRPVMAGHRDELVRWIEAGSFGPASRKVYVLERAHAKAPLVDLREPDTLVGAFMCVDCGGDVEAGQALDCLGCGRAYARNAQGAFAFTTSSLPREAAASAPSVPATIFELAPDWLASTAWATPVHNYLHAFAPDAPVLLRLKLDAADVDADEAVSLLAPLLAPFQQGRFPELELTAELTPEGSPDARACRLDPAEWASWSPERFQEACRAAQAAAMQAEVMA
jgi:hypothetical protein